MAKVIVYSKNGCPNCVLAKSYLTNRGLEFEERNIEEKPEYKQEVASLGYMQVPVVVVELEKESHGLVRESTVGFNVPALDKMINDLKLDS